MGGGMVPLFDNVFRDDDMATYAAHVPSEDTETETKFQATTPESRYVKWRTWQMSDHAPLWIEMCTDSLTNICARSRRPQGDKRSC